jgi:hypothetical protein
MKEELTNTLWNRKYYMAVWYLEEYILVDMFPKYPPRFAHFTACGIFNIPNSGDAALGTL